MRPSTRCLERGQRRACAGSAWCRANPLLTPGFANQILRSGESLVDAYIDGLSPSDRVAYDSVGQNEVLRHWVAITQARPRFALGAAAPGFLGGSRIPTTVSDFCDTVGLASCKPGSELHAAISRYSNAFNDAVRSGSALNSARQIVRALPASGCP
jgi:hypothetical protein